MKYLMYSADLRPATHENEAASLGPYKRFCRRSNAKPWPADFHVLTKFLDESSLRMTLRSLRKIVQAIRRQHLDRNLPDPLESRLMQACYRVALRRCGYRPLRLLQTREFAEILERIPNDPLGIRDKAMILLVYTARILSFSLSKIDRTDVHFSTGGLRINALYNGRKEWTTIANHPDPRYCAVVAMRRYLQILPEDDEASVFRALTGVQQIRQRRLGPLSAKRAIYLRLNPPGCASWIGLRTLYVSALMTAVNRGASDYRIMRQFGFRSIEEVRRWRERYGPASATIGEKLGL
jgi:hypothetical protein